MTLRKLYKNNQYDTFQEPQTNLCPYNSNQHPLQRQSDSNKHANSNFGLKEINHAHSFDGMEDNFEEASPEFVSKSKMSHHFQEVEMKFSFNQDWESYQTTYRQPQQIQDSPQKTSNGRQGGSSNGQRQEMREVKENPQSYLKEVQNTMSRRKQSIGSIRKNRKGEQIENKILYEEFFKSNIDLEQIQNIRMSKLNEMNEKLNRVINKENLQRAPRQVMKHQEERRIEKKTQTMAQKPSEEQCQEVFKKKMVFHVQNLFERLDGSKSGMLSKANCDFKGIPEEFKFIFGTIFTKIIIKGLICNKQQFTKLCLNALKETQSSEIFELFENNLFLLNSHQRIEQQTIKLERRSENIKNRVVVDQLFSQKTKDSSFSIKSKQRQTKRYYDVDQSYQAVKIAKQLDLQSIENQNSEEYSRPEAWKTSFQSSINQRRRPGSISESIIMEHKQGLKELNDLDKMVTLILTTQQLSEQNALLEGDESLNFGELVKHI